MSTKLKSISNSVSSIETKGIAKGLGVLTVYAVLYFLSFMAFAAMGRRGTFGSLLFFVIVIAAVMTAAHYTLKSRGW